MNNYFFVNWGHTCVSVKINEIDYVQSNGHRLEISTDKKKTMPSLSLKEIEQILPEQEFVKVNRSAIVAIRRIVCFDKDTVYLEGGVQFGLSDLFKEEFKKKVRLIVHKEKRD